MRSTVWPQALHHLSSSASPCSCFQRALSNQLNSCLNRQAIKAGETEDGDHCSKSTRRQNKPSFPLSGPPNSPGDPERYLSICGNKCLVPRLSDIIAFVWLSLRAGIVSLWALLACGEVLQRDGCSCL